MMKPTRLALLLPFALAEARAAHAPIVQWLPLGATLPCTLRRPEGDLVGACEPAVAVFAAALAAVAVGVEPTRGFCMHQRPPRQGWLERIDT